DQHLLLLSPDLNGQPPFLNTLTAQNLHEAAKKLRLSHPEIADLARPLTPLGVRVSGLELLEAGELSEPQLYLLFEAFSPFRGSLRAQQILTGTKRLRISAVELTDLARSLGIRVVLSISELVQAAQENGMFLE